MSYRSTAGFGADPVPNTALQDTIRTNVIKAGLLLLCIGAASSFGGYSLGKATNAKSPEKWAAVSAAITPALLFVAYVGINWSATMQLAQQMQAQQAQLTAASGGTK